MPWFELIEYGRGWLPVLKIMLDPFIAAIMYVGFIYHTLNLVFLLTVPGAPNANAQLLRMWNWTVSRVGLDQWAFSQKRIKIVGHHQGYASDGEENRAGTPSGAQDTNNSEDLTRTLTENFESEWKVARRQSSLPIDSASHEIDKPINAVSSPDEDMSRTNITSILSQRDTYVVEIVASQLLAMLVSSYDIVSCENKVYVQPLLWVLLHMTICLVHARKFKVTFWKLGVL